MHIAQFTFNPFQENTYILYDDSKECMIVDPGCNDQNERTTLVDFIEANGLTPTILFNTHCHIDHVLGNAFVSEKYNIPLTSHEGEKIVLDFVPMSSQMYGVPYDNSPAITESVDDAAIISFGNTSLNVLFTPGHSPASVSLFEANTKTLIAGDVLFRESIGRTDLPGGDFDTLIKSIQTKFWSLPNETTVFSGHGPSTTIGYEKKHNPFLSQLA